LLVDNDNDEDGAEDDIVGRRVVAESTAGIPLDLLLSDTGIEAASVGGNEGLIITLEVNM
jgi:hypothetical protein